MRRNKALREEFVGFLRPMLVLTLACVLLLKEPDGGMDEQQKALHAALGTPRRQRAVGVRYCKDTEARSHYVKASLAAQCDAWVHVDRTTALAPLRS